MKPEELGAWQALLQEEFEKPYWQTLSERVDTAYAASAVYPPREALFAAFRLTPPEAVRAVILGQDPYHEQELRAPYFAALLQRVGAARAAGTVYPPEERTFFALTATPPERVRAVILGQDPYHEPGQAMGLAFSVPQGERLPPSLRNIFGSCNQTAISRRRTAAI